MDYQGSTLIVATISTGERMAAFGRVVGIFLLLKGVIGFWQIVLIYKKDRSTEAHKMNNEYVINLCVKNSKLFVTQFLVESSQQDLNCIYIFALRTSYLTVQLKYYTIISILLM